MVVTLFHQARHQLRKKENELIKQKKEELIRKLIEDFSLEGDFPKIMCSMTSSTAAEDIEIRTYQKLLEFEVWYKISEGYEKLHNKSGVYLGSGNDIEYPILLGLEHVFMVDPMDILCTFEENVQELERRIKQLTQKEEIVREDIDCPMLVSSTYSLKLDLNGIKDITLEVIPQKAQDFKIYKKIGMIINDTPNFRNVGELAKRLVVGGYYIGQSTPAEGFKERLNIYGNGFYEKVKD